VSYQVRLIASTASASGFRLAGLAPLEIADPQEGEQRLNELLQDPRTGVILIEDAVHRALPAPLKRQLAARALPMIVPFPAPRWARPPEDREAFIAQLLQQAIGYRVRLG
jgi:vacuolar-type H+-ATPase subunit F/Vma7